jgi:hypothetical protein
MRTEVPPSLDLMIADDHTFSRIEATAHQKVLDGQQIRIPDALRLIALKLHAARDRTRRTTETDWQDVVGLLRATKRTLEDPELRATSTVSRGSPQRCTDNPPMTHARQL